MTYKGEELICVCAVPTANSLYFGRYAESRFSANFYVVNYYIINSAIRSLGSRTQGTKAKDTVILTLTHPPTTVFLQGKQPHR